MKDSNPHYRIRSAACCPLHQWSIWSGMRESNPRLKLGRLLCYLYTNTAYGARRGNRTPNLRITSALRYQLRHAGKIDAGD